MSGQFAHTRSGSPGDNARNQTSVGRSGAVRTFAFVAISALLLVSGCEEARVPVYPVTGKVAFRGKPPVGAKVVLHAANPSDVDDVAPSGTVQSDGTFAITVYEPGDGAPQGDYVATVQWFKIISGPGGTGAGPNVLPKRYASASTSPIKVSVASAAVQIPPIDLK